MKQVRLWQDWILVTIKSESISASWITKIKYSKNYSKKDNATVKQNTLESNMSKKKDHPHLQYY